MGHARNAGLGCEKRPAPSILPEAIANSACLTCPRQAQGATLLDERARCGVQGRKAAPITVWLRLRALGRAPGGAPVEAVAPPLASLVMGLLPCGFRGIRQLDFSAYTGWTLTFRGKVVQAVQAREMGRLRQLRAVRTACKWRDKRLRLSLIS